MSLEMQRAYEADGGVISASGEVDLVDMPDAVQQQPEPVQASQPVEVQVQQAEPPMPEEPPFDDGDDFASLMG
jgi:hypothetical protein